MRLFARRGNHREGDFATTVGEVRHFAFAYSDHNVYVAPNPTCATGGSRHSAKDVTRWSYFLIDMDPVEKRAKPEQALWEALLWLGEWTGRDFWRPGNVPIIIDSGRGCQAWVRLEDWQCANTPEDIVTHRSGGLTCIGRTIARRVNGYWLKRLDKHLGVVHGCKIDTSVSDLPRVMRCPGTINVKTGKTAKFITASETIFTGLARLLVMGTPPGEFSDPEPVVTPVAGQSWQMVFPHLTRMAQTYLTQGQAEPGRHKVMWHTAKKLREVGVEREQARCALAWANSLQGASEALPPDQIEHAIETAYGS